jgi:hypothetical protein
LSAEHIPPPGDSTETHAARLIHKAAATIAAAQLTLAHSSSRNHLRHLIEDAGAHRDALNRLADTIRRSGASR